MLALLYHLVATVIYYILNVMCCVLAFNNDWLPGQKARTSLVIKIIINSNKIYIDKNIIQCVK